MKPKIEKPKVFISYAWGTLEYQRKVIEFAQSLTSVGIDVELDKWSLKEGNDTYAFMEQSVQNPEITNVLILLDKNYTDKANKRAGGVGTETQIISPEIYNKTKQEKFIPIVFERGEKGEVCKPIYLQGLLHFDLSNNDNYESEFKRLVRRLFGIEILKKPEIGNPPNWLEEDSIVATTPLNIANIKKSQSADEKMVLISNEFKKINKQLIEYILPKEGVDDSECLKIYAQFQKDIRDSYLYLIKNFVFEDGINKIITKNLEDSIQSFKEHDFLDSLKLTVVHEIFIYYIALLFKNERYSDIGYVLSKTYFYKLGKENPAMSFNIFYSRNYTLDSIICRRDKKTYFCGAAQYWIDNIAVDYCTRNEFILADIIIHNFSVYSPKYTEHWCWFPVLYVYLDRFANPFREYAIRLVSKENLEDFNKMMCFDNIVQTKKTFEEIENEYGSGKTQRYRYNAAFDEAPMFLDYVESKDLGKYS